MFSVKIIIGALLLLTALISVPMAYATPPTAINGTFTITIFTVTSTRIVGGNTIQGYTAAATAYGDISGAVQTTGVQLTHSDGLGVFVETNTFTGSVLGRTGTFFSVTSGTFNSDGSCKSCKSAIIHGTDGLAGILGMLTFQFISPDTAAYSGHVHFSP